MPLCAGQTYNGPKVWFSATVDQEPDVWRFGEQRSQECSAAIVSS